MTGTGIDSKLWDKRKIHLGPAEHRFYKQLEQKKGGFKALLFNLLLLTFFLCPVSTFAAVKLPALISDNMVLQQHTQAHLWGWADPGEHIHISIAKREFSTQADEFGSWQFYLPQLSAGVYELAITGTSKLSGSSETSTVTVKNVAVGEVWLAAGQSNMAWPDSQSTAATEAIASAKHPEIRFFRVARNTALDPQEEVEGQWEVISPATVGEVSAVAYYFARRVQQNLDVPLGIIQSAWNGTKITAWTSVQALAAEPSLQPLLDEMDRQLYPVEGESTTTASTDKPAEAYGLANPNTPAVLYNAMIAPLHAYTLQGVLWYQGESDVHDARQYRVVFPMMIRQWRQVWRQQLPFLFVQLANFEFAKGSKRQKWTELRAAQAVTHANVPATGMVTAIDVGAANDFHPPNNLPVGERLAGWALARVYGQDVDYLGPEYAATKRESSPLGGQQLRLQFSAAQGLNASGQITAFELAGEKGTYHPAQVRIDGEAIVLHSDKVAEPAWLRYAWRDNPVANVYNQAGLPLKPFLVHLY